jgi:tetratricopeptide (TPR) repeat protein
MSAAISMSLLRTQGIEHFNRKDYLSALACIEKYLLEFSDDHGILNLKARALDSLGRPEEALTCVDRCLEVKPNHADDLGNRATLLSKLGRRAEALVCLEQILVIEPGRTDILLKRAQLLHNLGQRENALQCAQQAVRTSPTDLTALNMRGMILDDMERREEALADFLAILKVDPNYADAITNRGIIHGRNGEFRKALACYDHSLSIKPHQDDAVYNRAVVRLVLGDWPRGFAEFESRWKLFPHEAQRLSRLAPRWTGRQGLSGKTILLHHEQGYGDSLQFSRYAGLVKGLGAQVILAVPAGLKKLMQTLPGSPQIVSEGEPVPPHDYHCPLMSLPLAFGTTPSSVPAPIPYLRADPAAVAIWRERLSARTRPRIGVVWSGRQFPPINHARDMSLRTVRMLFSLEADFVCLHTEIAPDERSELAAISNVSWLGRELKDFADTAALIENLDLVISVDSAVAHLAGALGKPVWLMNRYASCWRWLLERTDSPWYPTMRLFRQQTLGDWTGVVREVLNEAKAFVGRPACSKVDRSFRGDTGSQPPQDVVVMLQDALDQHNRGQLVAAIATYNRVLTFDPRQFDALHYLGVALAQSGRCQEALVPLAKALEHQPNSAVARNHYGNALAGLGRHEEAIESYKRASQCNGELADSHYNCGVAWMALGRQEAALECYSKAIALDPHYAQAHNNLGSILAELGEPAEALLAYQRAIDAKPLFADPLINRSNLLRRLHRCEEAVECADLAIQCAPKSADAHNARGAALADMGMYAQALENYERAIAIHPSHAEALWNAGLVKLAHGDFEAGWGLYEHRWNVKSLKLIRRFANKPAWTGTQPIDGKVVLVHAEQGYGDTIQFCRYGTALAARGARVILSVPQSLRALLATVAGVDRVVAQDVVPPFDLHCPLMSLPRILKIDIEGRAAVAPYLKADPSAIAKWADRLGPRRKAARIGIAWAGRASHANDSNRSIPLQRLQSIACGSFEWISLQKEVRTVDELCLAKADWVLRLGEQVEDFADTAALIENLDLVITVDTAIAHLAGALGKPVWVLLPQVADWRWLREREDSPWYSSARLFRQSARGDWANVIDRVIRCLPTEFNIPANELVTGKKPKMPRSGTRSRKK